MRLGDLDALSAFVGDLRSTLHKEQAEFNAMTQSEFEIKDSMLLSFQYAIDNAPTVERLQGDLISREYVKLFVCEYEKFNGKETEIVKAVPIIAIENAPTVEERQKGEWIKVKEERMSIDMSGEIVTRYKCSKCGRPITILPSKLADYPFCHCGAEMKGGAE